MSQYPRSTFSSKVGLFWTLLKENAPYHHHNHHHFQLRISLQFQEYHNYHTALDGRRLAVSNEDDITVYFMDDVGDDERWESGRASVEGAGSARLHVNNTMLLESDKLVYQGSSSSVQRDKKD